MGQAHCTDSYPCGFLLTCVTWDLQKCFTWPHPLKCQRWGVVQGTDRSSQELFWHKSRKNCESLRGEWRRRRRQDPEGSRAPLDQLICCTPAVPTVLKHFYTVRTNDRGLYIYLLKDRFVIVDIINFHYNLGSTCERMGPSRGIIISSCDIQNIFCPLQLRKWACTKSN